MNISFDLDGTLIPYNNEFETESRNYFAAMVGIEKIINQKQNIKTLKELKINASKYPVAYNFHLHIDDSEGVRIESETSNFKMILVQPTDINWTKTIMQNIKILNTIE